LGDRVVANLVHARGNDYARLAYSIPIGHDGWRVGTSGSYLSYEMVADDFNGLDAKGTSSTLGLDATYPLIRSRRQNLYLGLSYTHKRFDNEANHAITTRYGIDTVSVSLNGNLFDKLGGGSANAAGLTLTQGKVDLGSLDISEDARLDGGFTKLNYYLSRQQVITNTVYALAALSGQAARENLDSAEKFYLGGAYGVRAYPANEGGGAEGQLINLELRWRLPQNFVLVGFYDWGHVSVNPDNYANTNPNSYDLKGAGIALAWQANFGLNLKATWAHRIGDNPNPTASGNDQDGSLHKNRWWLAASLPF
jgi:hemolysin activation/secretion protein